MLVDYMYAQFPCGKVYLVACALESCHYGSISIWIFTKKAKGKGQISKEVSVEHCTAYDWYAEGHMF